MTLVPRAIAELTMNNRSMMPPGYKTAKVVLKLGRQAFFDTATADLPTGRSIILRQDDLTPQFGYVGERYPRTRVLVLGINPGNGRSLMSAHLKTRS